MILRKDLVLLKTYHLMIPIFFILVNLEPLNVGDKVQFDTVRGEKGLNAVKINKI